MSDTMPSNKEMAFAELGLSGMNAPDAARAQVWATMLIAEQIASAAAQSLRLHSEIIDRLDAVASRLEDIESAIGRAGHG